MFTGSYLHEFMPHSPRAEEREVASSSGNAEVLDHDGGIPIFRLRSAEETEVAHDLLELSRSLPPLPPPGQASAVPLSSLHEDEPHLVEHKQVRHIIPYKFISFLYICFWIHNINFFHEH